ncbi:hypothetical protein J6590_019929 [Homalodisca vitripennis]|nr:hypothetical protein J6590_019929 [Homalodisca vitripennis]
MSENEQLIIISNALAVTKQSYCNSTDDKRKEETWILAYMKIAGATTSMSPRLVSNATLLKTNNSIARINNSQVGCGSKRLKLPRGNTLVHSCAPARARSLFSRHQPPLPLITTHSRSRAQLKSSNCKLICPVSVQINVFVYCTPEPSVTTTTSMKITQANMKVTAHDDSSTWNTSDIGDRRTVVLESQTPNMKVTAHDDSPTWNTADIGIRRTVVLESQTRQEPSVTSTT